MTEKKYSPLENLSKDSMEPIFSKERPPIRQNQITSKEQLKVGAQYQTVYSNKTSESETLELIAIDTPEEGWMRVKIFGKYPHTGLTYSYVSKLSLVDCSVIPDERGYWNTYNYLIPAEGGGS